MIPTTPGIYRDVSVEEYNQIPAVRRTFLWDIFDKSPGRAMYRQEHPETTEALSDGTMVHTSVLQPEEFPRLYKVLPPFEMDPENLKADGTVPSAENARRTKYYKDQVARFETMCESDNTEIVDSRKYDMAYGIGKNIRAEEVASRFFKRGASSEATAVWVDARTGLLRKARYDCLVEEGMPTACDIKTAHDASPAAFYRSCIRYGYYFQAADYLDGLIANGLKNPNFLFVVGEKSPPFPVASPYECSPAMLQLGRRHVREALKTYKQCADSGEWPYFKSGISTLELSDWDLARIDGRIPV